MSVKRLGILKPPADVPSLLTDVNSNYFASVIITNLNQIKEANLTVYVKPFGATAIDQYSYIIYNFPLARANSLETNRFAMNPLDEVWVESSINDVSFVCVGIPQPVTGVRYTNGTTGDFPFSPTPGDLFYDDLSGTFNIFSTDFGWQGILPQTGYNTIDGGNASSTYDSGYES
jgi:hypothetical protein